MQPNVSTKTAEFYSFSLSGRLRAVGLIALTIMLRRLDRYSTISNILNFQCETAREVPLRGMRSMLNLDTFSWQESPCKLYIYILIVNALQLNELSALRNTFYLEYKYIYIYIVCTKKNGLNMLI